MSISALVRSVVLLVAAVPLAVAFSSASHAASDWQEDLTPIQPSEWGEREAAHLAGEFARAASEEREEILAALEFEQWLAQACLDCQDEAPEPESDRF